MLNGFYATYPEIAIDFFLKEGPPDFTSERIDVAFRDGKMEDSQIVAKQLIPMQMVVCASPGYASLHGLPCTVEDLEAHNCINYRLASGRIAEWEFKVGGICQKVCPKAKHIFNDAELIVQAVLDGRVFRSPRGQIQEWEFRINGFRQRFVPLARHTFNDADLIVRAVCAGLGIAQLPAYQVDDPLAEGKLVRCLTQYAPEDGALYLCHPYRQKAAARLFAVYVSEAACIGAQKSIV